jgi:hypothetical protein
MSQGKDRRSSFAGSESSREGESRGEKSNKESSGVNGDKRGEARLRLKAQAEELLPLQGNRKQDRGEGRNRGERRGDGSGERRSGGEIKSGRRLQKDREADMDKVDEHPNRIVKQYEQIVLTYPKDWQLYSQG